MKENLARLQDVLSAHHPCARSLSALQQTLWAPTYIHSLKAPFFAEYYSRHGVCSDASAPPLLDELPLVQRSAIQAARDAEVTDREICRELFTGGSGGRPFVFKVRDSELRFLNSFFAEQMRLTTRWRRGIRLSDLNYPNSRQSPVPIRFHDLSLYGKGSIDYGSDLLSMSIDEEGVDAQVSVLTGGERALRAFSAHVERTFGARQLDMVLCFGTYLTKQVRAAMERQWLVAVVDRYGLSEIFGGATQDVATGWYQFDPWVIAEILDIRTRKPVAEGIGVAVLTPLYPFQQAQPLIRYWTDDLVQVSHSVPGFEDIPLIKPVGRVGGSVFSHDGDLLLLHSEIADVVEFSPIISNIPWFKDNPTVNPGQTLGYPCYRVEYSLPESVRPIAEIRVRVAWRARATPEEIERESFRIVGELTDLVDRRTRVDSNQTRVVVLQDLEVVPRFAGVYQVSSQFANGGRFEELGEIQSDL